MKKNAHVNIEITAEVSAVECDLTLLQIELNDPWLPY